VSKRTILIADDEANVLSSMKDTLDNTYTVYTVNDGSKVFDAIKKHRPDLIMLDVMMPEMDGITACRKLKEDLNNAAIPVMFVTAKSQLPDIEKGFKAGAVEYIIKPFSPQQMLDKVGNIMLRIEREERRNKKK
jgi:putative two-component system response regulator